LSRELDWDRERERRRLDERVRERALGERELPK